MSLIAEALDAAQRERAKKTGVKQHGLYDGVTSFRSVTKRARPAIPREVAIALAGFAGVVVIAAAVSIITANAGGKTKRPLSGSTAAPPIPLPVQSASAESTLAPPSSAANADTLVGAPSSYDAYDRAIRDYEPLDSRPADFGRARTTDPVYDELAPPDEQPPPKATPKGSFKITMQPGLPATVNDRFFQQALAAQQRGDMLSARDSYIKSLAANPSNAAALNNLGAVYRSLGIIRLAEESYRKALAVDPKFAAAWSNLAVVLDAQGKRQDATAALQEALRLDPRNVSTKVNLAIQFAALGLVADARRLLEEAIRDNPTLPEAHYTLGQVLEREGEKQQASVAFRAFLANSKGRFPQQEIQVRQHLKDLGFSAY